MLPLVSIIIPAYNHEKYVEQAVLSAVNQIYTNIEVILLNDGSTDKTPTVCERLADQFQVIRYFSHSNMGAHCTINKGIREARGQYIAVLNSDDIFLPDKIERCVELVGSDNSLQLVCGDVSFIDDKSKVQNKGLSVDWLNRSKLFLNYSRLLPLSILNENFFVTTSNMFFSKKIWEKVNGFQSLRYCHDLDFLMAAFRSGNYLYDKDRVHIKYRVHAANTIKEKLSNVRLEIAAVIAVSFIVDNIKIFHDIDITKLSIFFKFMENKGMSKQLVFLMMYYQSIGNRELFYRELEKGSNKQMLLSLMGEK